MSPRRSASNSSSCSSSGTVVAAEIDLNLNFDNDDNDNDNHEKQKSSDKRRNNKKDKDKKQQRSKVDVTKVFELSGQTDAERREIRHKYRELGTHINAAASAEDLEKHRRKNNKLFRVVAFTREAVLDADNNLLVATKLAEQAERLVQVPSYDPIQLVQRLRSHCAVPPSGGRGRGGSAAAPFRWRELGKHCGLCFNAVPTRVSFWSGPLDAAATTTEQPNKVRAARAPRAKPDNQAAVELKEVQTNDELDGGDKANRLSACERALHQMKDILKTKTKHKTDICGVQFLLNPHSFTQTVENVFNYSFLIKRGEGAIGVRDTSPLQGGDGTSSVGEGLRGLYVGRRRCTEGAMRAKQSVVALTMRDWRRLVDAHNLVDGDLPHRGGPTATGPPAAKRARRTPPTSSSENSNDNDDPALTAVA